MNTREQLLFDRTGHVHDIRWRVWRDSVKLKQLEQAYGSVLYTPLDIPRFCLRDPQHFKDWWNRVSKPISKLRDDIAGPPGEARTRDLFNAVTTDEGFNTYWEMNVRTDMYAEFPELYEHLRCFPTNGVVQFSIWSSNRAIRPHRDARPTEDLPAAFRVLLLDENDEPTLRLQESPTDSRYESQNEFAIPRIEDSNSFAWNNVRVMHSSTHNPGKRKWLMLIRSNAFDLDRYEELLSRSLTKYKDYVRRSSFPLTAFVDR